MNKILGFTLCLAGLLITLRMHASAEYSAEKFPAGIINSGVNIHFTRGHEKDLDMIAEAGIKYIRMDFVWQNIELKKGVYDWSEYDELTTNLKNRGLKALYILDYSNSLYEPEVESKDPITGEAQKGIAAPCNPESIEAFAKWAAAAVTHYKGNDIVWEIWNEPNITFWRPAPDVDQYLRLAFATCKAIRSVDPEAIIIGPATSQIPLPFIESFLASGILDYIDGVSVHPYRDYSRSPETAIEEYSKVAELIKKYSPAGKNLPIISSEWGYASATKGISVATQAAFIVRMQLSNLLYGVPLSIWYDWKNDGIQPGNFEHNCGTVTYDLDPKPAYVAIKTLNEQLGNYKLVKRLNLNNDNDFVLLFKDDNGNSKVVAWTTGAPHDELIKGITANREELECTNWKGSIVKITADNGSITLALDVHPQFITLPSGRK